MGYTAYTGGGLSGPYWQWLSDLNAGGYPTYTGSTFPTYAGGPGGGYTGGTYYAA